MRVIILNFIKGFRQVTTGYDIPRQMKYNKTWHLQIILTWKFQLQYKAHSNITSISLYLVLCRLWLLRNWWSWIWCRSVITSWLSLLCCICCRTSAVRCCFLSLHLGWITCSLCRIGCTILCFSSGCCSC